MTTNLSYLIFISLNYDDQLYRKMATATQNGGVHQYVVMLSANIARNRALISDSLKAKSVKFILY